MSPVALAEPLVARLASTPTVTPALLSRAAAVASAALPGAAAEDIGNAMSALVDSTLRAQGHRALPKPNRDELPAFYDPAFLNADTNLVALAAKLGQVREARLLLHGPPGTGKTAFARWLAKELDMPLMICRGSDLLGKYVGQTEQNIAAAFAQAEEDGALLLIDEVDTFLAARDGGRQGWENSMVNELLTVMEAFGGVLVATTNRLDALDPASMRRFDGKVRMGWLKPADTWALVKAGCEAMGLGGQLRECQLDCHGLDRLAPGDIAAVLRRARYEGLTSSEWLAERLRIECRLKGNGPTKIGFL